jgi:hypothetical protein
MERSVYSAQPGLPSIENKKAAEAAFGWFDDVELTQAGSVFGNGLDFDIGQLGGDGAHHLFRIVGTLFAAERLQLSFRVFGNWPERRGY